MNTLTYNSNALAASTPSAGLWRRAANLYWTGWSQYAESMNTDVSLRPAFPVSSRLAGNEAPTVDYGASRLIHPTALTPDTADAQRLIDRAA